MTSYNQIMIWWVYMVGLLQEKIFNRLHDSLSSLNTRELYQKRLEHILTCTFAEMNHIIIFYIFVLFFADLPRNPCCSFWLQENFFQYLLEFLLVYNSPVSPHFYWIFALLKNNIVFNKISNENVIGIVKINW